MSVTSRVAPWPDLALEELPWSKKAAVDWNAEMRRHGQRVVVSLLARGLRPARAKELAQEAWLRVIERHREGRWDELKLPGVVITQAHFLALDERRRNEQRYPHDSLHDETPFGESERFEQQVLAREQLRTIQRVLELAHPNARRVFDLMYGGEAKTAPEIAALLGLSVQRVRQIACELRQRIREALDVEGGARDGR